MTVNRIPNAEPDTAPPPPDRPPARPHDGATTGTAKSRATLLRPAVRKPTRARLLLAGATGSGKTWTALSIAARITAVTGGRIIVVDTEVSDPTQTAAELYADRFTFETIAWAPPYDPRDLALTIRDLAARGELTPDDVLIPDSLSHFWRGDGGTLDISGNRIGGWKVATPAQEDLIAALIGSPCHVLCCVRSKMDYLVEEGANGKQTVTKVGMAPVQRDDLEYDFQVVANMDAAHEIEIGKTRCADLAGRKFGANHQGEFADVYAAWLERGTPLATMNDLERVRRAVAVTDQARRVALKAEFKARFGPPDFLTAEVMPAVDAWLADHGLPEAPPPPAENIAGAEAEQAAAHAAAEALAATTALEAEREPVVDHRIAPATAEQMDRDEAARARADLDAGVARYRAAFGAETDSAEEEAERAAEEEEARSTVETLRERIAALEGKANGSAPPPAAGPVDEAQARTEADEARWVATWAELSALKLLELSEKAQALGLPAGGKKVELVQRIAEHLYANPGLPAA